MSISKKDKSTQSLQNKAGNNMNNSIILSRTQRLPFDDKCLNKNVCVVGASGSGKTYSYASVNIYEFSMQGHSMVIADTKGNLIKKFGNHLKDEGYKVIALDLKDTDLSTCYNPFEFVENERDVLTVARIIVGQVSLKEPYWDEMAGLLLQSLIAYMCLEQTIKPKNINTLIEFFSMESAGKPKDNPNVLTFGSLIEDLRVVNSFCLAVVAYDMYAKVKGADTTEGGILSALSHKLMSFISAPAKRIFCKNEIDFCSIGAQKTAVFVIISDNDRSLDGIGNIFFSQAIVKLTSHADNDFKDCRLPVPVEFILDDFGTQTVIPDFDNMIATMRSRNIYASVILQSVSQLEKYYDKSGANTIIACCDTMLYFGGNDFDTASYVASRIDRSVYDVMNLPQWKVWVMRRGYQPVYDDSYDLRQHPLYSKCADANGKYYERESVTIDVNSDLTPKYEMLRYDTKMSSDVFYRKMEDIISSMYMTHSICRAAHGEYNDTVCYVAIYRVTGANILCAFERRKNLLDEYYYHTHIVNKTTNFKGKIDKTILLSYSSFNREEKAFAKEMDIILLDRSNLDSGTYPKFNKKSASRSNIL